MGDVVENVIDKCSSNIEELSDLKEKIESIKSNKIETQENTELRAEILDLKCRSMEKNLIFSGLDYERNEHCVMKIQRFLQSELQLPYSVNLEKAHRFGKIGINGVRPIIARFVYKQ